MTAPVDGKSRNRKKIYENQIKIKMNKIEKKLNFRNSEK